MFHFWCLRSFALGREGEDRTGALLADREAALYEVGVKEAELAKKEALLEEGKAEAAAEAKKKVRAHAVLTLTHVCDVLHVHFFFFFGVRFSSRCRTPDLLVLQPEPESTFGDWCLCRASAGGRAAPTGRAPA